MVMIDENAKFLILTLQLLHSAMFRMIMTMFRMTMTMSMKMIKSQMKTIFTMIIGETEER